MKKQKSTGELLEVLKKKNSYTEGQEEIKGEQYSESLSAYLNGIAAQKDIRLSDVMRRSGLKKSYFYSLFDGKRENPTRDVLIQLCFGFQMSFDEVQEFLKHLGAAQLYPRIPRDGAIIYAFQHGMDIIDCDILLEENGEALLVKE
ncbi:MAG: helix-turn-helix domain-containing protein [Oscillospiraceae bacterium]